MSTTVPGASEAEKAAPQVAKDSEAQLERDIRERVAIITGPDYHDPSVRPLNLADYVWLSILCGVIPIVLLIWGWFQV
jgi:hypothetical protein